MPITNGYATLAEFKARAGVTDAVDDATIEQVIEAVSREIDKEAKRRFWKNSVAEARYYTADDGDILYTDDIVSLTTVKVDELGDRTYSRTLATTDYDLEPLNAALDGEPYIQLRIVSRSPYAFSTARKGNELTGIFGWNAVPKQVKEACLIQSQRIFMRKDAPFGVTGSAEMGQLMQIVKLDPDVMLMLRTLIKEWVVA